MNFELWSSISEKGWTTDLDQSLHTINCWRVAKAGLAPEGHILVKINDGTKTVYAHLSKFNNSIEKFITKEQYKIQSFEITRYPEKNKFYFNKGDLIGYSGNTGSSSGPHLHFEIRDSNNDVLDPLSYNFIEIKDTVNPTFEKVIFKTLDINSRINGGFGYYEYSLIKKKINII